MAELETRYTTAWTRPTIKKSEGLDQLGVDADGRLVLIELKDATAPSIYDAPLQLLRYVLHWIHAYDEVRADLDALRDARIALGLSPARMPRLSINVVPFGPRQPVVGVFDRFRRALGTEVRCIGLRRYNVRRPHSHWLANTAHDWRWCACLANIAG